MKCVVKECPRDAKSRGFCNRHYENWRLRGDPVPTRDLTSQQKIEKIGWKVVGECWEWKGARNALGYALLNGERVSRLLLGLGPGEVARHSCDNPPCVRPGHLLPGSHADNMADMVSRGRHWKHGRTKCPNGHDLTAVGAKKPNGECRACSRARNRRYEARKRQI